MCFPRFGNRQRSNICRTQSSKREWRSSWRRSWTQRKTRKNWSCCHVKTPGSTFSKSSKRNSNFRWAYRCRQWGANSQRSRFLLLLKWRELRLWTNFTSMKGWQIPKFNTQSSTTNWLNQRSSRLCCKASKIKRIKSNNKCKWRVNNRWWVAGHLECRECHQEWACHQAWTPSSESIRNTT